jgi:hypothetical protein
MRAHQQDIKVQEGGCLFVWSVLASIHNESYITYGLEMTGAPGAGHVEVDLSVAGRLAELGAVTAVMAASLIWRRRGIMLQSRAALRSGSFR